MTDVHTHSSCIGDRFLDVGAGGSSYSVGVSEGAAEAVVVRCLRLNQVQLARRGGGRTAHQSNLQQVYDPEFYRVCSSRIHGHKAVHFEQRVRLTESIRYARLLASSVSIASL
jgi:hypothetical protein